MRALAAWVKDMRGEETQTEFGARVGISQSTISQLEIGGRRVLAHHIDAILAATNTPLLAALKMIESTHRRLLAEDAARARSLLPPSDRPSK